MAVLLALLSALAYGVSDFVAGALSRHTSAWSVAVVGQASSLVCVAALAPFVGGHPAPSDFAWALVAGTGGGAGAGFLYRGFAAGRMAVVAPVSGVGAAVVPVLAGVVAGERPELLVWLGILVALPGIWLVATPPAEARAPGPGGTAGAAPLAAGLVDGVLAGLAFGGLFAALGQIPQSAGWWPLALTQGVAIPVVVALAVALREPWLPRGRTVRWALGMGPLGATATGAFLLAAQQGYLTVTGVIASLYPAGTVLLATVVLHERVHRAQAAGLALCAVAVVLVAGG
jgi:drug/metabolite transporter (DMT)-like permease